MLALRHLLKVGLCIRLAIVSSSFHVSLLEIKGAAVIPVRVLVAQFQRDHWKMQCENKQAMTSKDYKRCP